MLSAHIEHIKMDYRAYLVGDDGHFKSFEAITADNDERAIEIAKTFVDGHDVELWQLDRKVTVLCHQK
jgi:hypothetical protein